MTNEEQMRMEDHCGLTHALEEVCNILNKCGYELGNGQDTEYTNTATEYIDQVVEEYHTNKR